MKEEYSHLNFKNKKAIYMNKSNLKEKRFFSQSLADYSMFLLHSTMLPLRWLFFLFNENKIILPAGSWKILPTPFVHSCPSLLISFIYLYIKTFLTCLIYFSITKSNFWIKAYKNLNSVKTETFKSSSNPICSSHVHVLLVHGARVN